MNTVNYGKLQVILIQLLCLDLNILVGNIGVYLGRIYFYKKIYLPRFIIPFCEE